MADKGEPYAMKRSLYAKADSAVPVDTMQLTKVLHQHVLRDIADHALERGKT